MKDYMSRRKTTVMEFELRNPNVDERYGRTGRTRFRAAVFEAPENDATQSSLA
jgi:hypothetical protein